MKFPYALSDFGTLRREGYFYQDRTDRIPSLEEAGRQLIFIRPRRFGKSLLLSMLDIITTWVAPMSSMPCSRIWRSDGIPRLGATASSF